MYKKIHTHYDNLKVAPDAPIEVIRAAYRPSEADENNNEAAHHHKGGLEALLHFLAKQETNDTAQNNEHYI